MSERDTGGPAFPTDNEAQTGNNTWHYTGMTLRDYFAAKAMAGMLAAGDEPISIEPNVYAREAGVAYAIADAMLKARQQ